MALEDEIRQASERFYTTLNRDINGEARLPGGQGHQREARKAPVGGGTHTSLARSLPQARGAL